MSASVREHVGKRAASVREACGNLTTGGLCRKDRGRGDERAVSSPRPNRLTARGGETMRGNLLHGETVVRWRILEVCEVAVVTGGMILGVLNLILFAMGL